MDKFFIRKIVSVWAFDKLNEAVWKCNNIDKLKITQDGEVIRKKDAQGATIFKMDTAKSANISFEVSYWDLNILSAISGSEVRNLDGSANPYTIVPIVAPYVQTHTLTSADISRGYIVLDEPPRKNYYHYALALNKIDKSENLVTSYHQRAFAGENEFAVLNKRLMLPTSLRENDSIEAIYEYDAYYGTELVNRASTVPETWKVKILMLVSPICNPDVASAIWITANNASPTMALSLDFGTEDNIPVNLELGYSICDAEKRLYEIVAVDRLKEGSELRTYDTEVVFTHDDNAIKTIK